MLGDMVGSAGHTLSGCSPGPAVTPLKGKWLLQRGDSIVTQEGRPTDPMLRMGTMGRATALLRSKTCDPQAWGPGGQLDTALSPENYPQYWDFHVNNQVLGHWRVLFYSSKIQKSNGI